MSILEENVYLKWVKEFYEDEELFLLRVYYFKRLLMWKNIWKNIWNMFLYNFDFKYLFNYDMFFC